VAREPCSLIVHPTVRHAGLLRGLISAVGTTGNLTTGAHLAALSVEYCAAICSYDADFPGFLAWRWLIQIMIHEAAAHHGYYRYYLVSRPVPLAGEPRRPRVGGRGGGLIRG
jgi:hypothetical protein